MRGYFIAKLIDLTGKKFGRLTVIKKDGINIHTKWLCQCSCGNPNLVSVYGQSLKRGLTQSCGCIAKENLIKRNTKHNMFVKMDNYYIGYDSHKNTFKFDHDDIKEVSKYNWCCTKNGYVSAILPNSNRKHISLHRLIMHVKDSNIDVDHINHDTTDNRKENLRLVSAEQNACNMKIPVTSTTKVKGVIWNKKKKLWMARAMKNYKSIHLGYYKTFDDAVDARKNWEVENQKEYRYRPEEDVTALGRK